MRAQGSSRKRLGAFTYPHTSVIQRQICTIEQNKADVCDVFVDKEEDETDSSQCRLLGKSADVASTL